MTDTAKLIYTCDFVPQYGCCYIINTHIDKNQGWKSYEPGCTHQIGMSHAFPKIYSDGGHFKKYVTYLPLA